MGDSRPNPMTVEMEEKTTKDSVSQPNSCRFPQHNYNARAKKDI